MRLRFLYFPIQPRRHGIEMSISSSQRDADMIGVYFNTETLFITVERKSSS